MHDVEHAGATGRRHAIQQILTNSDTKTSMFCDYTNRLAGRTEPLAQDVEAREPAVGEQGTPVTRPPLMERLMLRLTGRGGAENDQVAHAGEASHQLLRRFARETVPDFERYYEVEAAQRW